MGGRTTRRVKAVKSAQEPEVQPRPPLDQSVDNRDAVKSRPNRADRKRQKRDRRKAQSAPLPPQRLIKGIDLGTVLSNAPLMPQLASRLHPDFAKPNSPYDKLFETDDERLFWFDGRHLARVSSFFSNLFEMPLIERNDQGASAHRTTIPLHGTRAHGLALLLHLLLTENTPFPALPAHILAVDFLLALDQAYDYADLFDIQLFGAIAPLFVVRQAKVPDQSMVFEAYTLALLGDDPKLAKSLVWRTLAQPLESMPRVVLQVLEKRFPASLAKLRDLHALVRPAISTLRQRMILDPIPGLPFGRGKELPDCKRFACAITTGYPWDEGEQSITRSLAATRVIEGLFSVGAHAADIHAIVQKLNTCEERNARLSILFRTLVLEFEYQYRP